MPTLFDNIIKEQNMWVQIKNVLEYLRPQNVIHLTKTCSVYYFDNYSVASRFSRTIQRFLARGYHAHNPRRDDYGDCFYVEVRKP